MVKSKKVIPFKSHKKLPNAYECHSTGQKYAENDLHEKAIEQYTHAIELEPMVAEFYDSRGFSYLEIGHNARYRGLFERD